MADPVTQPTNAGWGVQSTGISGGIVTDYEKTVEPQRAYLYDSEGAVINHKDYDEKTTVTATMYVEGDTVPMLEGYDLVSSRIVENNKEYKKMIVTFEKYTKPTAN